MSIVDDLENSTDIVELVSKFVRLKKAWANYKWLCPFPGHSEKTPSFVVSPSKQLAYCFWCHRGGGPLKFLMDLENSDFKEALENLAQITGRADVVFHTSQKEREEEKNIYSLHSDVVKYYSKSLKNNLQVIEYLRKRGITESDIDTFHLGYAESWIDLYHYLSEKWYKNNNIEQSKIFLDLGVKKDKFTGRIIFPIQNNRGDFVWFAWRIIEHWEPKYLNSPATNIYDKSSILYWLFQWKKDIVDKDFVIICEWYMDVIALHRAGIKNTVCVSGTALTEKQIEMLKRLTSKYYLCFDSDNAWKKATLQSIELLKNKWIEIKIITIEWGKDPDEFIKAGGDFNVLINNALSPVSYFLKNSNFSENSIDEKKKILKDILEWIKAFSDNVERDFYIKEVAEILNINIKIVYDEFNKIKNSSLKNEAKSDLTWKGYSLEIMTLAYILTFPKYKNLFEEKIIFKSKLDQKIISLLWSNGAIENFDIETKNMIKWAWLEIEEETSNFTEEKIIESIEKLIEKININLFKNEAEELKKALEKNGNDIESIMRYNELIKTAKKYKIKT